MTTTWSAGQSMEHSRGGWGWAEQSRWILILILVLVKCFQNTRDAGPFCIIREVFWPSLSPCLFCFQAHDRCPCYSNYANTLSHSYIVILTIRQNSYYEAKWSWCIVDDMIWNCPILRSKATWGFNWNWWCLSSCLCNQLQVLVMWCTGIFTMWHINTRYFRW